MLEVKVMPTQEELRGQLLEASEGLHAMFPGDAAQARLEQFDSHLGTALMVIDHLFDEAERMKGYK